MVKEMLNIKKSLVVLLVLISFVSSCFGLFAMAVSIVYGDVTGDGEVTAADARLVLRYSAELEAFTEEQLAAADVRGAGEVTAADARLILRFSAGLEAVFPAAEKSDEPDAFAVYIDGEAADLGSLERITQKVTLMDYSGNPYAKELSGDVYADAERLIAALGLKSVSGEVMRDVGIGTSTAENILVAERNKTDLPDGGCAINYFAIEEGFGLVRLNGIEYDGDGAVCGNGTYAEVLSTLAPKMLYGRLYVPVSMICQLLEYRYELTDIGFYIVR